jgi:putative RecB family exonuclease
MTIYSHSRLNTFETCPQMFKYRYLDKIRTPFEKTVETHLGKVVHETLEWLYTEVGFGKIPELDDALIYYRNQWTSKWEDTIKIVRKNLTKEDYFNKGLQFLVSYYMKHKPFNDNTIDIEKKVMIDMDEEGKYRLQGFIDRLVYNLEEERYEVHDYKTANSLPLPGKVEKDKQLALYSIGIKNQFGQDKEVILVWHYLAFNRRIESRRTNEQLEDLKKEIIGLIDTIESTTEFPPKKSGLCNWCEFQPVCSLWNADAPTEKAEMEKCIRDYRESLRN